MYLLIKTYQQIPTLFTFIDTAEMASRVRWRAGCPVRFPTVAEVSRISASSGVVEGESRSRVWLTED